MKVGGNVTYYAMQEIEFAQQIRTSTGGMSSNAPCHEGAERAQHAPRERPEPHLPLELTL
jgi:hypothetical protein